MSREAIATDFGSFTITGTAGTLFSHVDAGHPTSLPTGAESFKGRLETGQIRARLDGTVATAAVGELIGAGEDILLSKSMIAQVSLIATGSDSKLQGHFYNIEASVFWGGA